MTIGTRLMSVVTIVAFLLVFTVGNVKNYSTLSDSAAVQIAGGVSWYDSPPIFLTPNGVCETKCYGPFQSCENKTTCSGTGQEADSGVYDCKTGGSFNSYCAADDPRYCYVTRSCTEFPEFGCFAYGTPTGVGQYYSNCLTGGD